MPLTPISRMMEHARRHGYAVGYFESWDIASLAGVLDAAERTRSPVIIGFNGEFVSAPAREAPERLEWYGGLGRAAAESAGVPCGLIFNECTRHDWVRRAIHAGFNLVMPVSEDDDIDAYTRSVRGITSAAHAEGVAVEAEIGHLPGGLDSHAHASAGVTDPDQAADFVSRTGADLIAVSAGNVHVLVDGEVELDLDHLARIRDRVGIPMVLHGGSGISRESVEAAIALGVHKMNYGTYLKQRCLHAVREALARDNPDPHKLLGMGGREDVLGAARRAVRDAVLERIDWLGCCGQA